MKKLLALEIDLLTKQKQQLKEDISLLNAEVARLEKLRSALLQSHCRECECDLCNPCVGLDIY